MKKIHNENSRSEYFTFKPLSGGDSKMKERNVRMRYACVQEGKQIY